jgi:hypothetical protein
VKNEKGQALVEYILVAAVLIGASYGMAKLFAILWKAKFVLLKTLRAGTAGMGP